MRECRQCHECKPLDQFTLCSSIHRPSASYYKHTCRQCTAKQRRMLRKLHKSTQMPKAGACPLCCRFVPIGRWVLDHDHETGMMRGWICSDCNCGIGKGCESILVLENWIQHLESSRFPRYRAPQESELTKASTNTEKDWNFPTPVQDSVWGRGSSTTDRSTNATGLDSQ